MGGWVIPKVDGGWVSDPGGGCGWVWWVVAGWVTPGKDVGGFQRSCGWVGDPGGVWGGRSGAHLVGLGVVARVLVGEEVQPGLEVAGAALGQRRQEVGLRPPPPVGARDLPHVAPRLL